VKKKPRVALVLFGQPRFVELGWSAWSHKFALRRTDYQVFGHVWFDPAIAFYDSAPWSGLGRFAVGSNAIDKLRKQYPNIQLQVDKPRKFDVNQITQRLPSPAEALIPDFERRRDNLPNTASHCYSIHRALEIANAANDQEVFDFFVLSRYDTFLGWMPNLSRLSKSGLYLSNHHDAFPDMIFIGSPECVNKIDGWKYFETDSIDQFSLVGEEVKRRAFLSSSLFSDLRPIHMTSHAIRSGDPRKLPRCIVQLVHYEVASIYRGWIKKIVGSFRQLSEAK